MSISANSTALRPLMYDAGRIAPEGLAPAPTRGELTNDTNEGQGRARRFLRQFDLSEAEELAKLGPVRIALEPSDEVALFGTAQEESAALFGPNLSQITKGQATDANGNALTVDIIAPTSAELTPRDNAFQTALRINDPQLLASRTYARNNDVVFATSPLALLAA